MPENLTTFAPNRLPLTDYLSVETHEIVKHNAQALFLGATDGALTTDETISAGHKHASGATRLAWKQLHTFQLFNSEGAVVGTAPEECFDACLISSTSSVELAGLHLFISAADAAILIPRVRVSNDNSATTTCTITLDFYEPDGTTLVLSTTIVFTTATLRDRVWIDGAAIDVDAGAVDVDHADRIPLLCFVSGVLAADTEDVAVHEIAFGVTP